MNKKSIWIKLIGGEKCQWSPDEYTDYEVSGDLFVVKNGDAWVGIYPLKEVRCIEVSE